ncbi:hypothetical protein HY413_02005 [Candidatus Kaiserbacteria bacterium]|nr:hypothetical protein [Candidatus Kaiserbacteria bacterium]
MARTPNLSTVVLEGKGQVTLNANAHVATGGEGSIYRIGDTGIKIYLDPDRIRREGLTEKVRMLSQLRHPYIVAPQGLVTTTTGVPVGFYMPFADGTPLPRLFTNDFRKQVGFTDPDASKLVEGMREGVQFAHDHQAIMVDGNELNYLGMLAKKRAPEPRFIDVDSWTIGRWKSTAIMLSIRDWHAKGFTPLTDWFSWGIVTFQLYTGIHPYKGRLDGFDFGDFESRMKANASVFRKSIRLNNAVRDFSCIPAGLAGWYEAVFEHGERTVPPSPLAAMQIPARARTMRVVATGKGTLVFEKLLERTNDEALRVFPCGVALFASGTLIDLRSKREIGTADPATAEVARVEDGWLIVSGRSGNMRAQYVDHTSRVNHVIALPITGEQCVRYENRLFIVSNRGLTEIVLKLFGKPILAVGQTWGAMPLSTRWFDGCGIQDALGAAYLVAPYGDAMCAHIRVRELDGITPVAAKSGNRFVAVAGIDKSGTYRKYEFACNKDYDAYTLWQGKADGPELNMAILARGVCATIVEDGRMSIFVPSTGAKTDVQDPHIATDMTLYADTDRVVYTRDDAVWSVKMK